MRARIITIGDELLIGQVVDTNSAWLGEKLTSTGVEVDQIVSIQDKEDEIVRHLGAGVDEVDIIILSGGLGPTKDDITKSSIAKYLGVPMFYSQEVYDGIVSYLAKHGRKPVASIENHSWFPEGCIFLKNEMGTAPGMLFRKNGVLIISVPGVPYEMKFIMENEGLPLIAAMNQNVQICQRTILTVGEFEARLSDRIEDIVEALPPHFSIAFLPNLNQVRLRLTARGSDKNTLVKELDIQVEKIQKRLGNQVFGFGKENLAQALGFLLLKKNLILSTAESCTGGHISHLITSNAGSSDYYNGSIISYSNEIKMKLLNVSQNTLKEFGAVSEKCVIEMAEGCIKATGADIGISISGIAGPGGGSEEKPVGTIWMACTNGDKTITKRIQLAKDRLKNIQSASIHALDLARNFILDEY